MSLISNDVTAVHLLEQPSNSIPVWPTSQCLHEGECPINNCDTSGFVVASRAIGLETQRRPRLCLCSSNAMLSECRSSLKGEWRRRDGADAHLVFQLLALYVLLYALQEVIGVKVCMPWRMPEERKRAFDKLEKNGMQI